MVGVVTPSGGQIASTDRLIQCRVTGNKVFLRSVTLTQLLLVIFRIPGALVLSSGDVS